MGMRPAVLLLLLAGACASPRPVVYPDERFKAAGGEEAARKDAESCLADAKKYLKANPAKKVAGRTGWGAATGAALGAVVGAFTGDYARAVTEGAAVGGAGGAIHGAYEAGSPDEIQRGFTQRCMAEKGWSVIGWR